MYSNVDIEMFLTEHKLFLEKEKQRLKSHDIKLESPTKNDYNIQIQSNNSNENEFVPYESNIANPKTIESKNDDDDIVTENPFQYFDSLKTKELDKENFNHPLNINYTDKINSINSNISELNNNIRTNQMPLKKNEMDQWVTDTFYSYFPSFNKIEEEKRTQSRERQRQEYKDYLSQVPFIVSKAKILREQPQTVFNDGRTITQTNKITTATVPIISNANINDKLNLNEKLINYNEKETVKNGEQFKDVINSIVPGKLVTRNSARTKLLEDLKHTEFLNNLNSDTVAEKNKRTAEEDLRKKMEYQKDLVKQIEEKRLEIQGLKEKEKREEELLTRRLEEQLQTLELEKELEKEKIQSEKVRLANEQNHLLRMRLLSKLENDHKLYNPYDIRKTQSENGKDNKLNKPDDRQIYKYFSNSARYESINNSTHSHSPHHHHTHNSQQHRKSEHNLTYLPQIKTTNSNNNNQYYCKNCRSEITEKLCNFCNSKIKKTSPSSKTTSSSFCSICHKKYMNCPHCDNFISYCYYCKQNTDLCINCKMKNQNICGVCENDVTTSPKYFIDDDIIDNNDKLIEIHQKTNEIKTTDHKNIIGKRNTFNVLDIELNNDENVVENDSDYDAVRIYPIIYSPTRTKKPPFSMNLEKDSLFHPSKKIEEATKVTVNIRNGEVFVDNKANNKKILTDEINGYNNEIESIKHKNDEMLSNYVKNYSDLRARRTKMLLDQNLDSQLIKNNHLNINTTSSKTNKIKIHKLSMDDTNKIRLKYPAPAVPKRRYTTDQNNQPRVLTQLGAIRKQLKLEQFQMDKSSRD